jgi:starvation-inducible DNA-binding protein
MTKSQSELSRHGILDNTKSLTPAARRSVGEGLRVLLADIFTIYLKTKSYHWHMTGPHFRDYHLLLDEQADQLFAMTDAIAERARKLGEPTIHSVGEIARLRRLSDCDSGTIAPTEMLRNLREDNDQLSCFMRDAHVVCEQAEDLATASLLENWIDETERRSWFVSATLK